MLRLVLQIALALFVIWLLLTVVGFVFGGLIHLLWIVILILLAIWLWQRVMGRRRSTPL
jgi:hypothetical protein